MSSSPEAAIVARVGIGIGIAIGIESEVEPAVRTRTRSRSRFHRGRAFGACGNGGNSVAPLGLGFVLEANPQLTLWAIVCRCSAPGNGEGLPGKARQPQRGVSRQPGASPLGPENETKASPERADQDSLCEFWRGLVGWAAPRSSILR
jgi:hypothetical protein